jgi:hypothetical protein
MEDDHFLERQSSNIFDQFLDYTKSVCNGGTDEDLQFDEDGNSILDSPNSDGGKSTVEFVALADVRKPKFVTHNHYQNMKARALKPVVVDVGIEFHEKLISTVGANLKSTKERLHESELTLNLEPPGDELSQHEAWEAVVNDLLSHHRMDFPKQSQIQKQHDFNQLVQRQNRVKERAQSREDWNKRAAMILAKETQNLQKKILAGKCKFGGSVKGVELKTIQNYNGKLGI